ncbi:MAG TPA: hypothetical protein VFY44_03480 [Thermoleophilaceae bacterium]|nr:hypothetical protein [Thermoleophilaceae bacterium]
MAALPSAAHAAPGWSDLAVGSATTTSGAAVAGRSLAITTVTTNLGSRGAYRAQTVVYLSRDGRRDPRDIAIGRGQVPALAPAARDTRMVSARVPNGLKGLFQVIACANADRPVRGARTRNNCRVVKHRLQAKPAPAPSPPEPSPAGSPPAPVLSPPGEEAGPPAPPDTARLAVSASPRPFVLREVQSFTVTNTGQEPSAPVAISFAGADAAAYSVTANACAGVHLAVGASCSVSARFVPPAGPGTGTATLNATAGAQQASTALSGQAFGTLRVNGGVLNVLAEADLSSQAPTPVTIPIQNASLYPAPVAVRLNPSPVFVIAASTCGPDPLAPGASCAVELEAVNAPVGVTRGQLVVMNGPVTRVTVDILLSRLGSNF